LRRREIAVLPGALPVLTNPEIRKIKQLLLVVHPLNAALDVHDMNGV
jgi:hypothetical protein